MKKDILYILMLMMTAVGLSSCNEDNNTPDEYPDWKARNEEYFNKIYKEAVSDAKTDPNVKVIRNWSLPETHNNPEDFIVVKVLKKEQEHSCHYIQILPIYIIKADLYLLQAIQKG